MIMGRMTVERLVAIKDLLAQREEAERGLFVEAFHEIIDELQKHREWHDAHPEI